MPEPSKADQDDFEQFAFDALMDEGPNLQQAGPKYADELARIAVDSCQGKELKPGETEPVGQFILEFSFGDEGAVRIFSFQTEEQRDQALMMAAADTDPSSDYKSFEKRQAR